MSNKKDKVYWFKHFKEEFKEVLNIGMGLR